jgi:hypothetical protein
MAHVARARTPRIVQDPAEAYAIATRLGEELLQTIMLQRGCSRGEALRAVRDQSQLGRTPSAVMRDRRR